MPSLYSAEHQLFFPQYQDLIWGLFMAKQSSRHHDTSSWYTTAMGIRCMMPLSRSHCTCVCRHHRYSCKQETCMSGKSIGHTAARPFVTSSMYV